jgi:hypothetical protein
MKTIRGKRKISYEVCEPTEFEDCDYITVYAVVTGGANNLSFLNCRHVVISGTLINPEGPNDPAGHHILLDKCLDVSISVKCQCQRPSGDGINIFASNLVTIHDCLIAGPKDDGGDKAAAICIDRGSYDVEIRDNQLSRFGQVGISIASGHNLRILRNHIGVATSSGIQIDGSGYRHIIRGVMIDSNKITTDAKGTPRVWTNTRWAKDIVMDGRKIA